MIEYLILKFYYLKYFSAQSVTEPWWLVNI